MEDIIPNQNYTDFNLAQRKALKRIDEELGQRDIKYLQFLCKDTIPNATIEVLCRGIDIINELQARRMISDNNVWFLAELLYRIGRLDLVRKQLNIDIGHLRREIRNKGSQLPAFRVLLMEIIDDTTKQEMETMKFIAELPKSKQATVTDAESLFTVLENEELLSYDNTSMLQDMLSQIHRHDLLDKINKYNRGHNLSNHENHHFHRHQEMSMEFSHHNQSSDWGQPNRSEPAPRAFDPPPPYTPHPVGMTSPPVHNGLSQPRHPLHSGLSQPSHHLHNGLSQPHHHLHNGLSQPCQPGHNGMTQLERTGAVTDSMYSDPESGAGAVEQLYRTKPQQPVIANHIHNQQTSQHSETQRPELPCYKMDAKPRGICVIINNKRFTKDENDPESRKLPNREGTDVDLGNLEYIFKKLYFNIVRYENLTSTEMVRTMMRYSMNEDHSRYNCFMCCVLTHGEEGQVFGCDGRLIKIQDLLNPFKAVSCPSLRGKPKIFFIQACQGKSKQPGAHLQTDDSGDPEPNSLPVDTIPNEADFLLGYATLPGFVSYRSKTYGSWYITKLVEILDKYADTVDLLSIMIMVNDEVSKAVACIGDNEYKQSPAPMPTLRKRIYFR